MGSPNSVNECKYLRYQCISGLLTLLGIGNHPTQSPDDVGYVNDSIECYTPTKVKLNRIIRRNDKEVIECAIGSVNKQRVVHQ